MKKFIVFGLGISGNATVKFLLEKDYLVVAGDDNPKSLEGLNHYLREHQDLQQNLQIIDNIKCIDWQDVNYLVLAPGIALHHPKPHPIVDLANQNHCPIICDIEILYLFDRQTKFIGITGTNGKSTTTALTGHIFNQAKKISIAGGNIGTSALSLPMLGPDGTYIIETSSYQLDLLNHTKFHIANLINITPDHLDRHLDMAGYIAAKKRIFANQNANDFAVIGVDNPHSKAVYEELKNDPNFQAKLIAVSTKKVVESGVAMIGNIIYNNLSGNESVIDLGARKFLKGEHNAQNIAFAFANAFLSGIKETQISAAIKTFAGLKHRMQLVGSIGDIHFINDSKATNADSTENALKTYQNIYWILGGKAKEGGIASLEPYFPKIKYAFLIGAASDEFAKTLENKVKYVQCGDLKTAFEAAYNQARKDNAPDKNILLSPACASFDQWKNFEERGEFFCDLSKKIIPNLA